MALALRQGQRATGRSCLGRLVLGRPAAGWAADPPAGWLLAPYLASRPFRAFSSSAATAAAGKPAAEADEKEKASAVRADELQALAAQILEDRALAERLAASPRGAGAQLLSEAGGEADGAEPSARSGSTLRDRLVSEEPLPSRRQMKIYFMQHFVPFIGFGFFDNFIMILAGDWIDAEMGVVFGLSTMAAAAIGNTISDVFGLWISGVIETVGAAMGLPSSGLTAQQREDIRMQILKNTAMVSGIVVGCIMGMAPLLYPKEWRLWPSREQKEEQLQHSEQAEQQEERLSLEAL